jgi:hypothetical protein
MLKKSVRSLVFVSLSLLLLVSCKGTEDEQASAARRFSHAVASNDKGKRDSMIATFLFREYFHNQYVEADFLRWFRTFYDMQNKKFFGSARVDTDRKFANDLRGAMIDTAAIQETGIVRVTSPKKDEPAAYFWMVKQADTWKVAIVTKGEQLVHFVPQP